MERFLFICSKCDFEYSSWSKEPCKCPFCSTVNECYTSEETNEYICFADGDEIA